MKRRIIFLLLFLLAVCSLFSSCGKEPVLSSFRDNVSEQSSAVNADTGRTASHDNSGALDVHFKDVMLHKDDAQLLDASPLYFTEVLGIRKKFTDSLPVLIGFEYPYVFYERMSVIVEGTKDDDAPMYVGRYSVETQAIEEFAIDDFKAISNEARMVVDQERLIYMYCFCDEQGELQMNIALLDFTADAPKSISRYNVKNVFGYANKLNKNELVFLLDEATEMGTQQVVLLYDLQKDAVSEIYRGESKSGYHSGNSTKDIWAIDTNNGKIDLLMQRVEDHKMLFSLCSLDETGNTIDETELSALSMYDSVEDVADSLASNGDALFIHFLQHNKSENNTNAPFSMLQKTNDGYQLATLDDTIDPSAFFEMDVLDSPYVFLKSYHNKNFLWAVNVNTSEGYRIHLNLEDIQDCALDSRGNLLVAVRSGEKSDWYLVRSECILKSFQ